MQARKKKSKNKTLLFEGKKHHVAYSYQTRLEQIIHLLYHLISILMASNLISIPKFSTLYLSITRIQDWILALYS